MYEALFSKFEIIWPNKDRNSSISFVGYEELNNKSNSNIKSNSELKSHFKLFQLNYWINLLSILEIELDYQYQNPNSYYSGGIGNWLEINSYSKLNLFDENMKIDFILGFRHLGNRNNIPRLNFIEMVPDENIFIGKQEDIKYEFGVIEELERYTENKYALKLFVNKNDTIGFRYFIGRNDLDIEPTIKPNR